MDYHERTWIERHGGKDTRKGDRHLPRDRSGLDKGRKRSGKRLLKSVSAKSHFVAVDGEGWEVNGVHSYVLLGSSDRAIYDRAGLSPSACFDFLLSLAAPDVWLIGFSFNYDVVMMIESLPHDILTKLYMTGFAVWENYRLRYIPSKTFGVSRGEWVGGEFVSECSVVVYDTFGFFQKSFVAALKEYNMLSLKDEKFLTTMKARRGRFDERQAACIQKYNRLECQLLERVMGHLRSAFSEAGLNLSRWHGAGAGASAILKKYNVIEALPVLPDVLQPIILSGYYGGRIELLEAGFFDTFYNYDLRSAYSWALSEIPKLTGGYRTGVKRFDPNSIGLWRVVWDVRGQGGLSPFPFRSRRRIHWADAGEGIYSTYEVREALKVYSRSVKVREGVVFETTNKKPFTFVADLYRQRAEFKARGSAAQKALKLALNSLYGKLAQGISFGKSPAFQNYLIAGLITSRVRAELFKIGSQNPAAIIAFATDGIFSKAPLKVDTGEGLGQWEAGTGLNLFFLHNGVYQSDTSKRHRGFRESEVDFGLLRKTFLRQGIATKCPVICHRFMGLGTAIAWNKLDQVGTWINVDKMISGATIKFPQQFLRGQINDRFTNTHFAKGEMSEPYIPKGKLTEEDEKDLADLRLGMEQDNTLDLSA